MSRIAALLDIAQNARAREQQAVALPAALDLFGGHLLALRGAAAGSVCFDLAFDRLAFPTSCHVLYCRRVGEDWRSVMDRTILGYFQDPNAV